MNNKASNLSDNDTTTGRRVAYLWPTSGVFSYVNESSAMFNEQYMLWPIPQSEVDANPKLLPQNSGW